MSACNSEALCYTRFAENRANISKQDRYSNVKASSCNYCCRGKAASITYSECVLVALGIQHAMRMRHIVIYRPVQLYHIFPHYLTNGRICRKEKLLNIKYVFWFSLQLLSETFLISRRTERDMIKNVSWCSYKVPVNLDIYERSSNFLNGFSKNVQIPNFIKIRPCGLTDMTRLVVVFRKFANASKNC